MNKNYHESTLLKAAANHFYAGWMELILVFLLGKKSIVKDDYCSMNIYTLFGANYLTSYKINK